MKLRLYYGTDPAGAGFYWPENAEKRAEMEEARRTMTPEEFATAYQADPKPLVRH